MVQPQKKLSDNFSAHVDAHIRSASHDDNSLFGKPLAALHTLPAGTDDNSALVADGKETVG